MFVWGAYAASGAGFGGFTETIFHLTTRLRHVVVRLRRGRRIHTNGFAGVTSLHRRPSCSVRFVPSRSEDEGSALSISELRWDSGLSSAKKAAGTFFVCRLVSNARSRRRVGRQFSVDDVYTGRVKVVAAARSTRLRPIHFIHFNYSRGN